MTQRPARPSSGRPAPRRGGRLTAFVSAGAALVVVAVAAVVAVTTATAGGDGTGALEVSYDRSSQVLEFQGPTFEGGSFGTAAFAGTPAVVNFYASWCTLCDRELPDFQRVSQTLAGRVQFVGVNPQSNDTDEAQARMVERGGVTYPLVRDAEDALLREFNTTGGLPTTLFLDGAGVVRKVHNGPLTEGSLTQMVAEVLGVQA